MRIISAALAGIGLLLAARHATAQIVEATYGGNCGVARGNATAHVAGACNGKPNCNYQISYQKLGDPAKKLRQDLHRLLQVSSRCRLEGVPDRSGSRLGRREWSANTAIGTVVGFVVAVIGSILV
jgi:hypothetical protein